MPITLLRRTLSLSALALASACSLGDDPTLADPRTIGLSVTPSSSVAVGDTVQLVLTRSAGLTGDAVFTLHPTSTGGAVTVDSLGRVVGVGVGPAIVTATIGNRTAQVLITVRPAVRVAPRDFTLGAGGVQTVTADVVGLPAGADRRVTWSSADTTVATVTADGVVAGRRAGITRIVARSVALGDASGSAQVTVVEHPIITISVTPSIVALAPGETSQLAVAARVPAGASREVTFVSGNTRVATVSPTGLVTAREVGMTTITVALRDDPSLTTTATVSVSEPRTGPMISIVSITRADGSLLNPDSVSGEVVVEVRVGRLAGATRTLRLALGGVGSLTSDVVIPAATGAETVGTAIFRVNTAARDASGALRVPNGPQLLRISVHDGASATPVMTIERALTLANAGP